MDRSVGLDPDATSRAVPAPSSSRRESPYLKIREMIVTGAFQPGQAMPESMLAEHFEVSRTPIREALTRLEQDGLVDRTDRGLVVHEHSPEDVIDLYDTRIPLEAAAARTAADRRTQHDVIRLGMLAEQVREAGVDDAEKMVSANNAFHRAVWSASRNRSLIDLLERLAMHLRQYQQTTISFPGRWDRANDQHLRMVEAIEARDGEAAAAVATEHFSESRDIRVKLWLQRS